MEEDHRGAAVARGGSPAVGLGGQPGGAVDEADGAIPGGARDAAGRGPPEFHGVHLLLRDGQEIAGQGHGQDGLALGVRIRLTKAADADRQICEVRAGLVEQLGIAEFTQLRVVGQIPGDRAGLGAGGGSPDAAGPPSSRSAAAAVPAG